jgi:hypothetical protein
MSLAQWIEERASLRPDDIALSTDALPKNPMRCARMPGAEGAEKKDRGMLHAFRGP